MPTISMFYGIIVQLYFKDNDGHFKPHIHIRYQNFKASISIEDGGLLAGDVPPKQLKLVSAWVEIHKEELLADWELACAGESPFKIEPLR
jgi:hypothetical protein